MKLTFISPAKVNLFFKILKKKDNGYHSIASLYQAISLVDEITFELSEKDVFYSTKKELLFDDDNLIKKALLLFREKTKIFHPVKIYLKKNIPMQAGLGGGSSNAATTLWALNELFDFPLKLEDLIEISKKIGSDIAFFFSRGLAYCTNEGSDFENVNAKLDFKFYIAKPQFGMCTTSVYKNVDLKFLDKKDPKIILSSFLEKKLNLVNDLEISAFELEPRLKEVKNSLLKSGFEKVMMSGSGSSFICFSSKKPKEIKNISTSKVFTIQRNSKNWYSS